MKIVSVYIDMSAVPLFIHRQVANILSSVCCKVTENSPAQPLLLLDNIRNHLPFQSEDDAS